MARRLAMRGLVGLVRRAGLALCCCAGATAAATQPVSCTPGDGAHIRKVCLETVSGAAVYGHGILGQTPEWNVLTVYWGTKAGSDTTRPASTLSQRDHIFEDVAPRLADLDADGIPEILVVQSSFTQGARLMVIRTENGLTPVTTPYIGRRNRWLAPIGVADMDGDGTTEIGYIDRPHLARILRLWRYENATLTPVADLSGLTNHRIGEEDIAGGIRTCAGRPEMILASADWSRLIAVTFREGNLHGIDIGPHTGRASFAAALTCS